MSLSRSTSQSLSRSTSLSLNRSTSLSAGAGDRPADPAVTAKYRAQLATVSNAALPLAQRATELNAICRRALMSKHLPELQAAEGLDVLVRLVLANFPAGGVRTSKQDVDKVVSVPALAVKTSLRCVACICLAELSSNWNVVPALTQCGLFGQELAAIVSALMPKYPFNASHAKVYASTEAYMLERLVLTVSNAVGHPAASKAVVSVILPVIIQHYPALDPDAGPSTSQKQGAEEEEEEPNHLPDHFARLIASSLPQSGEMQKIECVKNGVIGKVKSFKSSSYSGVPAVLHELRPVYGRYILKVSRERAAKQADADAQAADLKVQAAAFAANAQHGEAVRLLTEGIKLAWHKASLLLARSTSHLAMGLHHAALRDAHDALRLKPRKARAWVALGDAFAAWQPAPRLQCARLCYLQALELGGLEGRGSEEEDEQSDETEEVEEEEGAAGSRGGSLTRPGEQGGRQGGQLQQHLHVARELSIEEEVQRRALEAETRLQEAGAELWEWQSLPSVEASLGVSRPAYRSSFTAWAKWVGMDLTTLPLPSPEPSPLPRPRRTAADDYCDDQHEEYEEDESEEHEDEGSGEDGEEEREGGFEFEARKMISDAIDVSSTPSTPKGGALPAPSETFAQARGDGNPSPSTSPSPAPGAAPANGAARSASLAAAATPAGASTSTSPGTAANAAGAAAAHLSAARPGPSSSSSVAPRPPPPPIKLPTPGQGSAPAAGSGPSTPSRLASASGGGSGPGGPSAAGQQPQQPPSPSPAYAVFTQVRFTERYAATAILKPAYVTSLAMEDAQLQAFTRNSVTLTYCDTRLRHRGTELPRFVISVTDDASGERLASYVSLGRPRLPSLTAALCRAMAAPLKGEPGRFVSVYMTYRILKWYAGLTEWLAEYGIKVVYESYEEALQHARREGQNHNGLDHQDEYVDEPWDEEEEAQLLAGGGSLALDASVPPVAPQPSQ